MGIGGFHIYMYMYMYADMLASSYIESFDSLIQHTYYQYMYIHFPS